MDALGINELEAYNKLFANKDRADIKALLIQDFETIPNTVQGFIEQRGKLNTLKALALLFYKNLEIYDVDGNIEVFNPGHDTIKILYNDGIQLLKDKPTDISYKSWVEQPVELENYDKTRGINIPIGSAREAYNNINWISETLGTVGVPEEILQEEQRDYQELESLLESTQEKLDKVEEKAAKKIAKKIEDNYHLPDGTSIELINSLLPDMDFQDVFMELALERHEILSNAQFQIEEHTWSSRFGAAASGVWDTLVYFKDDIYNNPGDYAVEIASVLPFGIGTAVAAGDTGYEVYQGRKTLTQAGVEIGVSAVLNVVGLKLVQKTGKALKNIGKVAYKNISARMVKQSQKIISNVKVAAWEKKFGKKSIRNMTSEEFAQRVANAAENKFGPGKGPKLGTHTVLPKAKQHVPTPAVKKTTLQKSITKQSAPISPSKTTAGQLQRVRKVNNRMPRNHELANQVYPLDRLSVDLRQKYPHSVPFNGAGFPDFSRYAIKKVQIKMSGNRKIDENISNKLVGFKSTPDNYTWHHHEDGKTMLLIPEDLHDYVKHTGGFAKTKGIIND